MIYPRHSEGRNPEPYVVELLQLALARSGGDYRLEPSAQPMPQSRAQLRLEQDDPGLQVMWAQSRDDLEETLLPIRIPIYRGLIGWRIPLVSAANKDILASARTLDDLRRLRFGQRQDWADTPIPARQRPGGEDQPELREPVPHARCRSLRGLPREVVVIDGELEDASRAGLHLAIDQHVALHYPRPSISSFRVNARNWPRPFARAWRRRLPTVASNGCSSDISRRGWASLPFGSGE